MLEIQYFHKICNLLSVKNVHNTPLGVKMSTSILGRLSVEIENFKAEHNMSNQQFCQESGISLYELRKIISGNGSINLGAVCSVCATLGYAV